MPITAQQLLQILPNAGKQTGVFASALNLAMDLYQINTRFRMAAFIAQVGHESGQFRHVKELGGDQYRRLLRAHPVCVALIYCSKIPGTFFSAHFTNNFASSVLAYSE